MANDMPELKNWWLDKQTYESEDVWIVKGNCYGNTKFRDGDIIHTSPVKRITKAAESFLVETENCVYMCKYDKSLETQFQWLDVVSLWKEMLSREDKEFYQSEMIFSKADRLYRAEQKLTVEIQDEEYILITFSDQRSYYFADLVCHLEDKELHLGKYVNLGFRVDSVVLSTDLFDLNEGFPEIDFRYHPYEKNRVQFYLWEPAEKKVFIKNTGKKDIVVDTYCGRFILKPNGKAYRIAPDAIAGRIAKYG